MVSNCTILIDNNNQKNLFAKIKNQHKNVCKYKDWYKLNSSIRTLDIGHVLVTISTEVNTCDFICIWHLGFTVSTTN